MSFNKTASLTAMITAGTIYLFRDENSEKFIPRVIKDRLYTKPLKAESNNIKKNVKKKTIVIVGGGVTGLSTAWHLAKTGKYTVTVFERESIGAFTQASSINSGFLHTEPKSHQNRDSPENWKSNMSRGTIEMYEYLHQKVLLKQENEVLLQNSSSFSITKTFGENGIEFRKCRMVLAIQNEAQLEHARLCYPTENELMINDQETPRIITAEQARDLEPQLSKDLMGAVCWPLNAAATCHPRKATIALAIEAQEHGVEIRENTEVFDIKPFQTINSKVAMPVTNEEMRWCVKYQTLKDRLDPGGEEDNNEKSIKVDGVILAAGAWCEYLGSLVGVTIPVIPVIGIMWSTFPCTEVTVNSLIGSVESDAFWCNEKLGKDLDDGKSITPPRTTHMNLWNSGNKFSSRQTRHLYGKQTEDGRFIFGGDRIPHPAHHPGLLHPLPRFPENSDSIDINREHASEVLPILKNLKLESTWAGIMPFSKDGLPIVGRIDLKHQKQSHLYVCSGMGGSGFSLGPMAGKLLADQIDLDFNGKERQKILTELEMLNPNRFDADQNSFTN